HVLLPDDGGLSEPGEGLRRLPGRRRHAGDVPVERLAALRDQRRHLVRGAGASGDADVVGALPGEEMKGPRPVSNDVRPGRRWLAVGIAAAALVAAASVVAWVYLRSGSAPQPREERTSPPRNAFPPDPRLGYKGPFRNVHPDVRYVGDEKCIDCHEAI